MPPIYQIHQGNALAVLQYLEPGAAQCCVTSPPYWGLRDYGDPKPQTPARVAGCQHVVVAAASVVTAMNSATNRRVAGSAN